MKLFLEYLKHKRKAFLMLFLFFIIFLFSFLLFRLPAAAVLYPTALCVFFGAVYVIFDFLSVRSTHKELSALTKIPYELAKDLPSPSSVAESDYGEIIRILCDDRRASEEKALQKYNDMVDYYTVWAHQIKTPIAAMRLKLQNEDSDFSRKLQNDLSRIESYVNMVLTFLRLESDSTDYLIKEYSLDRIIREAVKKFSGEFIIKKLTLDYTPVEFSVVTDEKWLSFVIEQILSNAVKYTFSGSVSVYMEENSLCIKDTGIGIAADDLPRIFENGFTGFNGRYDKRSSGIGLYLCRRICENLGHGLTAVSAEGEGTLMKIDFSGQM